MGGMLRIPRRRGTLSGVLLVLLGAWGGLIAFIGRYFHYAYPPDSAWSYTSGRLWLEVLPGAGALAGGLIALASASRPVAMFGAWLAAISGAWFALGAVIGHWAVAGLTAGTPVGGTLTRVVEQIGFFTGLGVVIVFLAALALRRLLGVGIRDGAIPAGTLPPPRGPRRRRGGPARGDGRGGRPARGGGGGGGPPRPRVGRPSPPPSGGWGVLGAPSPPLSQPRIWVSLP